MKRKALPRDDRLARMRAKLQEVDTGSGTHGFMTLDEGRNIVRILPEVHSMDFFFQTVGRHYMPNKKNFYCSNFTSEGELTCPICELVSQLYKAGDKSSRALAGQIRVRKQYWMNVIDRSNESRGPLMLTPGVTIFNSIVAMISDPDWGDITDVDEGIDLIITRTGKGLDTSYEVMGKRNPSPLSKDPKQVTEWLSEAKDLSPVEVGDDPEKDRELAEGHAVYMLPYDRVAREAGLEDDSFLYEDEEEEEDFVGDDKVPFDDEDDEDEDDEEDEPVRTPRKELTRRRAERRRTPAQRR